MGDKKLEWVGFTSTGCPKLRTVFLAGKDSAYRAVPNSVLAAATRVDKAKVKQWVSDQPATCIAGREKGWFRETVQTLVEEIREGLGGAKEEVKKAREAPGKAAQEEL